MAARRRNKKKRKKARSKAINGNSTSLRSAQNVYHKLKLDKNLPFDVISEVFIGYHTANGDCEISFDDFQPERDIEGDPFDRIRYYRTANTMLWDSESGIDTIFYSGDTRAKLKQNPRIADISMANRYNLPLFVRILVTTKRKSQTKRRKSFHLDDPDDSLIGNEVDDDEKEGDDMASSDVQSSNVTRKKGERYTHFLSIRIDNPLLTKLGTQLQVLFFFGFLISLYKHNIINTNRMTLQMLMQSKML